MEGGTDQEAARQPGEMAGAPAPVGDLRGSKCSGCLLPDRSAVRTLLCCIRVSIPHV